MSYTTKICSCGKSYKVKIADLNRNWGISCSKSCAAKRREKDHKVIAILKGVNYKKRGRR